MVAADVDARAARTAALARDQRNELGVGAGPYDDVLRREARADRAQERVRLRMRQLAGDDDLARPAREPVDGHQHLAEGRRIAVGELADRLDRALGALPELMPPGELC